MTSAGGEGLSQTCFILLLNGLVIASEASAV